MAAINKDTLVPLGAALAIAAIAFQIGMTVKGYYEDLRNRLATLETRPSETWGVNEQFYWELEFARDNPSLKVPEAREIRAKANR